MRIVKFFHIFLAFGLLFFAACTDESSQVTSLSKVLPDYLSQFSKSPLSVDVFLNQPKRLTPKTREVIFYFNQPMVDFAQTGRFLRNVSHVEITPKTEGLFEWVQPQMLVFRPSSGWEDLQDYQVHVEAGLESLLGVALLKNVTSTFSQMSNAQDELSSQGDDFALAKTTVWDSRKFEALVEFKDEMAQLHPFVVAPSDVLQVSLTLPRFLRIGDSVRVLVEFINPMPEKFSGTFSMFSEGLVAHAAQNINIAPKETKVVTVVLRAEQKLEKSILKAFLDSDDEFVRKQILMTLQNDHLSQTINSEIMVVSRQTLTRIERFGALPTARKQKLLDHSLMGFSSGFLSLSFDLEAKETVSRWIVALSHIDPQNLSDELFGVSPFVMFSTWPVVYGEDRESWQKHLESVADFLQKAPGFLQTEQDGLTQDEILRFADFVMMAKEAGFDTTSLQKRIAEILSLDLQRKTDLNQRVNTLWGLSHLDLDEPAFYHEIYLNWDKLHPVEQMRLAQMILKMNPLHPVDKLVRRSIDKHLLADNSLSVDYWAQAFFAMILANPKDSLTFEAFSQIFTQIDRQKSLPNFYQALLAFRSYRNFVSMKQPVDVDVFLQDHKVATFNLTPKKISDHLVLPLEKLPKDLKVSAQKVLGPFVFYHFSLKAAQYSNSLPIENQGVTVAQTCYNEKGEPQGSVWNLAETYECRVRWFVQQSGNHAKLDVVLPPLFTLNLVSIDEQLFKKTDLGFTVSWDEMPKGYQEFSYFLTPAFAGDSSGAMIHIHDMWNQFWGGRFQETDIRVQSPH